MSLPNTDVALVILCKRPRLGEGKQRLAESIGVAAAYEIASGLWACALEDAVAWGGPVVISPARQEDVDWVYDETKAVGLDFVQVIPQQEGNLGERINTLDQTLRQFGQSNTVYIGTDAPMLNSEHYRSVLEHLEADQVVLSKADDGGVVMMANSSPWPNLCDLPWSQNSLCDGLLSLCNATSLDTTFIQSGFDIDVEEDLHRFLEYAANDDRSARQALYRAITKIVS